MCEDCAESAADRGVTDVAWWCWMFGCSDLSCRCHEEEVA